MMNGILGSLPPGLRGYLAAEQMAQQRGNNQLSQMGGILSLQNQIQSQPLQMKILEAQANQAANPQPIMKDLGGEIGIFDPRTFQRIGTLPKTATPDTMLKEQGSQQRHVTPSGSAILGEQGSMQRHITPSGSAILTDERARQEGALNRGVSIRGQDLTDARAREQAERDKFGAPIEVTGPNGPQLVVQNRTTGGLVNPETKQPITNVGPKVGEAAQKQQTGVSNTQDAIKEYRTALKNWGPTDIANPNARARMGTIYNNMLLQAKEAYNLGVLNGPDYMILQEVITNPAGWTGAITSRKALDDQAAKLDEVMGRIGKTVAQTQTGRRKSDTGPGVEFNGYKFPSQDALDAYKKAAGL